MTFNVRCFITKAGKPCIALEADLGFHRKLISFDRYLCSDLANVPVKELLAKAEQGAIIPVGKGV